MFCIPALLSGWVACDHHGQCGTGRRFQNGEAPPLAIGKINTFTVHDIHKTGKTSFEAATRQDKKTLDCSWQGG